MTAGERRLGMRSCSTIQSSRRPKDVPHSPCLALASPAAVSRALRRRCCWCAPSSALLLNPGAATSWMSFCVTSANPSKGADSAASPGPTRIARRWRRQSGAGGRPGALSQHAAAAGAAGAERARPHRRGPVAERARAWSIADQRRRSCPATNNLNKATALTEQGDAAQRPRRHAQHARHPDRLAARRHARSPATTTRTWATGHDAGSAWPRPS